MDEDPEDAEDGEILPLAVLRNCIISTGNTEHPGVEVRAYGSAILATRQFICDQTNGVLLDNILPRDEARKRSHGSSWFHFTENYNFQYKL